MFIYNNTSFRPLLATSFSQTTLEVFPPTIKSVTTTVLQSTPGFFFFFVTRKAPYYLWSTVLIYC